MINVKKKYEIYKKLNAIPILFFEDYLISRIGKLYYLNAKTEELIDISHIIFNYTKEGIPIYRITNYDNENILELPLDKIVLNTFVGELDLSILHKDYDYKNCELNNLKYDLDIFRMDNGSLYIGNKEFKKIVSIDDVYISNDGIIYSTLFNRLITRHLNDWLYFQISFKDFGTFKIHSLVYETWVDKIPDKYTINHIDTHKTNNYYINLEAISNMKNIRHAFINDLMPQGRWKEEDIHKICQMLESNIPLGEMAMNFNLTDTKEKMKLSGIIYNIRHKYIWKDISDQYNIPIQDKSKKEDLVHRICVMLDNNMSPKLISDELGVSKRYVYGIKYGERHTDISRQYKFLNAVA